MQIQRLIDSLEQALPLYLQEDYDNSGLQVGDPSQEVRGVLLCVDVTEQVLEEAVERECNFVVAHHPLLFKSLRRLSSRSYIERCVVYAIRHNLVIYAAHTNADNAPYGLNYSLAEELGLCSVHPLLPSSVRLAELTTFVPESHTEIVQQALWSAGAGRIGSYDCCSYVSSGLGSFRPGADAHPYVGEVGRLHREAEHRLSVVFPSPERGHIERALLSAHPYEVPAYSIVELENSLPLAGSGIVGDLLEPMEILAYLRKLTDYFDTKQLRYSVHTPRVVTRVAVCGGAGAFLWRAARAAGADIFITGEAKYNDYFDVEEHPILVTVGHYESERVAARLFSSILSSAYPHISINISSVDANPIAILS